MNSKPVTTDDFVALDVLDEEQIVRFCTGEEMLDEMFYSFQQAGRTVVGLAWAGVNMLAQQMREQGRPIRITELSEVEIDGAFRVRACAECVGETRYGGAEQAKLDARGKPDPFAYPKALSKAQRNAMRPLIPESLVKAMYAQWLAKDTPTRLPPARVADFVPVVSKPKPVAQRIVGADEEPTELAPRSVPAAIAVPVRRDAEPIKSAADMRNEILAAERELERLQYDNWDVVERKMNSRKKYMDGMTTLMHTQEPLLRVYLDHLEEELMAAEPS